MQAIQRAPQGLIPQSSNYQGLKPSIRLNLTCGKLARPCDPGGQQHVHQKRHRRRIRDFCSAIEIDKEFKKRELNNFMPSLGLYGQGSIPDLQGRIRSQTSPAAID